jgi:hypothetical protein
MKATAAGVPRLLTILAALAISWLILASAAGLSASLT